MPAPIYSRSQKKKKASLMERAKGGDRGEVEVCPDRFYRPFSHWKVKGHVEQKSQQERFRKNKWPAGGRPQSVVKTI
ncbi:hypothetical protein FHT97_005752 [Rhizobium sp. BK399]|nr:hypothetical protein [Rhizobium sp. BK399]